MPTGGVHVVLRGGTYVRTNDFVLLAGDSGNSNGPVVFSAYGNEAPILVGGSFVTNWTAITNVATLARLTASARTNALQADLWAQGISNLGTFARHGYVLWSWSNTIPELFFNGHPMTLARFPNTNWTNIGASPAPTTNSFAYTNSNPSTWADLSDIWVHGYWRYDWADSCEHVASFDLTNKVVTVSTTQLPPGSAANVGQRFYFENVLEELDSAGEYYIDRTNGLVYFWPPRTMTNNSVFVTQVTNLITLNEASNVVISGLTLEGAKSELIYVKGGQNNTISNCVLAGNSRNAVQLASSQGSGVRTCTIYEAGEAGVKITGSGDRRSLTSGSNFVERCTIYGVGRLTRTCTPPVFLNGVGTLVGNNLISNVPHTAILLYGNNHIIEYNEIHHVCTETADAGAIYFGTDWSQYGNTFRYNYLHDIHIGGGATDYTGVQGIYLDGLSSGSTILGNVFSMVDHGIIINGGRDNTVQNNIFVQCTNSTARVGTALWVNQMGVSSFAADVANTNSWLWASLKVWSYTSPPWSTQYPALAAIAWNRPGEALGNVIQCNISYNNTTWAYWEAGAQTNVTCLNNFTNGDPGFKNYSQRNFALVTNSPVWALGFQAIPMNRIGPALAPASGLTKLWPP
jgi:parallel beta-helix repeat protein